MAGKILFITLMFWGIKSGNAQGKVVANIRNLKNDRGVCRVCLFNNASAFTGEGGKPYECISVPVKDKLAIATFNNVGVGSYALFVFHDVNGNNKIDKNILGIPKEGYGASRNKLPFASPPKFNDNKFEVENNKTVTLNVELRNIL